MSFNLPPGWRDLIEESWPAVTACDLLRGNKAVWQAEGLQMPRDDEAIALATMGRLVRYGQSIALNLPISRESTLPRLAFYLHRLRLDAAQGLILSPWLNRITMAQRSDLLVFGRPRRMLRDFVTSTVMRPVVVDSSKPLQHVEFQRTLLVSGHGDLLSTLEMLERQTSPFAIVVVVSTQGCSENSCGLITALKSIYREVPLIALGYTGQVLETPLSMHAWNTRLGDVVSPTKTHEVQVVAARDPVMNGFVKRLGYLVWNLKRLMEQTGGYSQEFTALMAIDRALRCLNVPLLVHEKGTLRRIRGGRFPVRLIQGWLEIAARIRGRRGDIQSLLDEILALVRNALRNLQDATPGRSEVILRLATQSLEQQSRMCILVGNYRDAEILQDWLEEKLGPDFIDRMMVLAMDGATAFPPDQVDMVVYAAPLYPSRVHWLGLAATRKIVVCHPFEQERVCTQIDLWWRANALPSARFGDKRRLWALDWPEKTPLKDLLVEGGASGARFAKYTEMNFEGYYPQPLRVAQLESTRSFDSWLDALLAEPTHMHRDHEIETEVTRDVVVLHLDGHSEPLRWAADRQIMRLEGETFSVCPARDLEEGNDLVVLGSSEERVATQRELFDMFIQNNHGLQQTLRVAEKWQVYVDAGVAKQKSISDLTRYLKSRKFNITSGAVQHWAAGLVIGPQDPTAIRLLAELAGTPNSEKMAKMVENAIVTIRGEHRRIGSDLRKAIAMSRSPDVSAVQIGTRRISRDVFDAMVEVCRVVRIERPSQDEASVLTSVKTIKDVARDFALEHASKIIFTPACERSMTKSLFEDLTSFASILTVLVDGFHPMHANNSVSLKQVEGMLAVIPASYAGGMADTTKGKFESDYFKLYKGQKVDIGRHIKLGRNFDSRYTLRLHFHWDSEDAKIVVHHAGEHLPTLIS